MCLHREGLEGTSASDRASAANLLTRRAVATRRTVTVWATVLVGDNVETWQVGHVHGAKHGLGVLVNLNALLDLEVDLGDVRDVVETLLALLLLELERDALNWSARDALHHVGGEASNLVAKALGWDHGDLIADSLVGSEVQGETLVVALNDFLRSTLHGLIANTALVTPRVRGQCNQRTRP